jgi:hypothetical protein
MSLDLIDYKRIACQRALDISVEAAPRGYMPLDLYAAYAQIVADRNPQLAMECLRALEVVCTARKNITPEAEPPLIIQ